MQVLACAIGIFMEILTGAVGLVNGFPSSCLWAVFDVD
jgi:hypothetical protein